MVEYGKKELRKRLLFFVLFDGCVGGVCSIEYYVMGLCGREEGMRFGCE